MISRFGLTCLLAGITSLACPALAYEIRPFLGVHEAITLAASECLSRSDGPPASCLAYGPNLGQLSGSKPSFSYSDLEISARWPDDPTRQVKPKTLFKFGFNAKLNCPRQLRRNPEIGNGGLLCSTHYGRLQFWHSMASEPGETTQQTRQKIAAWARFTFDVASGRIDPDTDYCAYFRTAPSFISAKMLPANFPFCSAPNRPGWRISTLFSMQCSNPISSQSCTEVTGVAARNLTRRAATGALLHLIQDSYSQSHAARGPMTAAAFGPRVECHLPTHFYDYSLQTSSAHSKADKMPVFATSCRGGAAADDVITASAQALWHVQERTDPVQFMAYLQKRVFGPQ